MRIIRYDENMQEATHGSALMLDACAEFWWQLYQDMPYIHRPDGYDWNNGEPIGPHYFIRHLRAGFSNKHKKKWCGEVTGDSIFVALEGTEVQGFLVNSI